MSTKIFVNLPVVDLNKSKHFYTHIGYTINPQFTDDTAACVVVSNEICVMLLTSEKFKQFTPRDIADASKNTEVINCLSLASKDEVNQLVEKALEAGGEEVMPASDYGFMFLRSITDPDGHIWELSWMDESSMNQSS